MLLAQTPEVVVPRVDAHADLATVHPCGDVRDVALGVAKRDRHPPLRVPPLVRTHDLDLGAGEIDADDIILEDAHPDDAADVAAGERAERAQVGTPDGTSLGDVDGSKKDLRGIEELDLFGTERARSRRTPCPRGGW